MPDHPIPTPYGCKADLRVGGKRVRKEFYRNRHADPFTACEAYIRRLKAGLAEPADVEPPTTLAQDLAEYHRWSEQDKKKAYTTVVNYRHMLGDIEAFLAGQKVRHTRDITAAHVRAYRTHFTAEGDRGDNTWGKYRQALAAFLTWASARGLTDSNPAVLPEFKIKYEVQPPETFEKDEIRKILEFIKQDDAKHQRAVPMETAFRFLFFTGARLGELQKALWADARLKAKRPTIDIGSKTKKKRTVPLHSEELLPYLLGLPRGNGALYLFDDGRGAPAYTQKQYYGLLQKACYLNDIRERPVHAIRHTFCRYLFEAGADINLVSKMMGHEDIRTTMIYAKHFSTDRAGDVIEQLGL